jgi:hypothetical protein
MRILILAVCLAAPAMGQDNRVTLGGGQVRGVGTINATAGSGNAQANAGIIAEGPQVQAIGTIGQHSDQSSTNSESARAAILDGAFSRSTGWVAVSGAAGHDNQQANIAAIAIGIEAGAAGDILLSQTRASQEPAGRPGRAAATGDRLAEVGNEAFAGSSGLVQVSLIGGDRNTSANSFALSVIGRSEQ